MNPSSTQIAAALRGALGSSSSGLTLSGMFGTVQAVNAGPPPSVNVYLNNNSTGAQPSTANMLPYMSDYNPVVGDAVFLVAGQAGMRTSYLVVGTIAGSSSGGGSSGVPIGGTMVSPFVLTIPNWFLLNGQTVANLATAYPILYALNGNSTTLPDWRNVMPMGAGSIVSLGANAGSQTANGLLAHTHTGPSHTHTGPSHTHTGPSHTHTGPSHTHPAPGSAEFALWSSAVQGLAAGTGFNAVGSGNTNTGSGGTGASGSSGTGATGSSGTGATGADGNENTGSTGSGSSFSVLNPVVGVNWYVRAA